MALLGLLDSEIGGLFVAPEAQGTGVGRRLVEHAAALHGSLTLEVYEKNTGARGFYARLGFVEESRRVDEEYDEVMLRLTRPARRAAPDAVRRDGGDVGTREGCTAVPAFGFAPKLARLSRANTDRGCRVSGVPWLP